MQTERGIAMIDSSANFFECSGMEPGKIENIQAKEDSETPERWPMTLCESSSYACYLSDLEGNVLDVNEAAEQLIGYEKEELLGRKFFALALSGEEQISRAAEILARHARRQSTGPDQLLLSRKDGAQVPVELWAHPVRIEGRSLVLGVVRDMTECRQAEEALRESEERYRLLAENVMDVIFTVGIDLRFAYVSPSVERLLGYSVEEAMALTMRALLAPESYEMAAEDLAARLAAELEGRRDRSKRRRMELELIHKDGSKSWAEVTTSLLHDSKGRLVEIVGVAHDITGRKRTEQALDESEENFRALAENAVDGILIGMDEGMHVYANKRAAEITGYTVSELRKANFEEILPPDELAKIMDRRRRKLEGKRVPGRYETVIVGKDGQTVPVEVAEAKTVWQGQSANMLIIRDISKRKKVEDQLRIMDSAIASSASAILIADLKGEVEYVNPAFLKLWRYEDKEEIVGKNATDFLLVADQLEEISEALSRKGSWQGELVGERSTDGSKYTIYLSTSMVADQSGKPIRIMGAFVDMTDRKDMEGKLRELYEQEKELRQELESEINKRVEFTRALVHELKTPLTSMMASIELLVDGAPGGPFLDLAKNLDRGAGNLNKRIDELLDLARGELGMLRLSCQPVDVPRLLHDVADSVKSAVARHGQTLVMNVPSSLPLVWADEERLHQVVLNLVNNALKFAPEGGTITLAAYGGDTGAVVEVQDTGGGIDEEDCQRLFEAYHRVEKDRDRLSGLGLGLSLCKTLVELHGGQIWVNSERGRGSTFGFLIPFDTACRVEGDTEAGD